MPLATTKKAPRRGSLRNPVEAYGCAWWAAPDYFRKDGLISNRVQSWKGVLRRPDRDVVYFDAKTEREAIANARAYAYRHYSQSDRAKAIRAEASPENAVG